MTDKELRQLLVRDLVLVLREERGVKVWSCKEICTKCRMPLIEFEGQDLPHCWYCSADNRAAQAAKDAKIRMKLKAETERQLKIISGELRGPFMFDMPL